MSDLIFIIFAAIWSIAGTSIWYFTKWKTVDRGNFYLLMLGLVTMIGSAYLAGHWDVITSYINIMMIMNE